MGAAFVALFVYHAVVLAVVFLAVKQNVSAGPREPLAAAAIRKDGAQEVAIFGEASDDSRPCFLLVSRFGHIRVEITFTGDCRLDDGIGVWRS